MALTVWISTDGGTDLDVFVVVRKHDPAGAVVPFYGFNGYSNDGTTNIVNVTPTQGTGGNVTVSITSNQPRFFSAIYGGGTMPVVASSKAQWPAQTSSSGSSSSRSRTRVSRP